MGMIVLYIILGIMAFITLLLFAYLRVTFSYRDERFVLYIRIGPICYKVPAKKKPRYRSLAKQLRGQKLSGPVEKQQKKQTHKEKQSVLDELRGDLSLPAFLSKIKDITIFLANRYAKKLHITAERLHITVGTGDSATTGVTYGVTVQSIAYLLEFLDNTVTLTPLTKDAVHIHADFAGIWDADIKVAIKIRIVHLLRVFLSALFILKSEQNGESQQNMKV